MTNKFMIPSDFSVDMKIREAAERYKVCQKTIKKWRSLARNGLIEAHNKKLRAEMNSVEEEVGTCLTCTKPRCTGHCDKFPY